MSSESDLNLSSNIDSLKKLMILDLVGRGFKQKHVAQALGVSEATISSMFPKGLLKEVKASLNAKFEK